MSKTSIMSIRELIDNAFGETEINVVNFKLMQTVLIILAKQLRVLERRVNVEFGFVGLVPKTLSVTEVKMHATVKKKIKGQPEGAAGRPGVKGTPIKAGTTVRGRPGSRKTESADRNSSEGNSTDKSTSEGASTDKTSSYQTSSDKTSSDKTSIDKTSSDKKSSEKTSSDKTSSDNTSTDMAKSGAAAKKKVSSTPLDKFEEQRERELRVIEQRADSREETDKSPTPMASAENLEVQHEKLIVVEKISSEEARKKASRGDRHMPQLSVVTQEQFTKLVAAVRQLEARFAPIATPDFPENAQLMEDLRRGASLTDAMAALQLSARLEAAEKALEKMISLVTDLASKTPGIDITAYNEAISGADGTKATQVLFGPAGISPQMPPSVFRKSIAVQEQPVGTSSEESIEISLPDTTVDLPPPDTTVVDLGEPYQESSTDELKGNWVTTNELRDAIRELYDEIFKTVTAITTKSTRNADAALQTANRIDGKLQASLNLGTRMNDVELLVSEYADQINALDTGLSSQMTNYQEQLTQMQHDLETGLETMAEALANTGGDTAAEAELNTHFTNLQLDFDNMTIKQKDLNNIQNQLALDISDLWKQIEILRATKSDREEVADALRDKAGLGALNGLVSLQQFDAVRGDFEKRIGCAYDKFNNQEIIWQKAIDDLIKELNEKADWIQLVSLRESINKNLDMLRGRIQTMLDIVGEPRAAAISRKLHRDAACLSCSTSAHMALEEPSTVPALPPFSSSRPPATGAEIHKKPKEDGDHGLCYPGQQIPHPRDSRSHICNRYCGGSHTVLSNKIIGRALSALTIDPALRQVTTGLGSDGKSYIISEQAKKPCLPCNKPKTMTQQPLEGETVPDHIDNKSDVTPNIATEEVCETPPPMYFDSD